MVMENSLSILKKGISILRDECSGVDCCPNGEDAGWSSCPESDMSS